jgi:hypothetical protein
MACLIEGPVEGFGAEAYAGGTDEAAMGADWEQLRDEILHWFVFGCGAWPDCPPWVFLLPGGPGFRPWAWCKFDAPEPLPDGETDRAYLERHGLMLPGEPEHPTMREQRAAKNAESDARIRAQIAENIAQARQGICCIREEGQGAQSCELPG